MKSSYFYYSKESEGCIVYSDSDKISNFYIHCWRVPAPIPKSIQVNIRMKGEFIPVNLDEQKIIEKPIIKTVKFVGDHEKTTRYDVIPEVYFYKGSIKTKEPPFQTIYIQHDLLEEIPDRCQVEVIWK